MNLTHFDNWWNICDMHPHLTLETRIQMFAETSGFDYQTAYNLVTNEPSDLTNLDLSMMTDF